MKKKILFCALCVAGMLLGSAFSVNAGVACVLDVPKQVAIENGNVAVRVLFMNTGTTVERCELPTEMFAFVENANGERIQVVIKSNESKKWIDLPQGGFQARTYRVPVADTAAAVLRVALEDSPCVAAEIVEKSALPEPVVAPVQDESSLVPAVESSEYITGELAQSDAKIESDHRSAMVDYFHKHFFGYDPIYFSIGGNPSGGKDDLKGDFPNTRFQISLRYTPISPDSSLVEKWHGFTNIFVTYTQNTIWDMNGESAPFLDSMFKPELQYYWRNVLKEPKGILERMDLTAAISHESNGRAGSGSRSINYIIARPTFYFGDVERLNGYVAPGFWVYFGSLSDNPEMKHYRGHADVRAAIQWADSIQLASQFRMGDELEHGNMQLDLTYPLAQITNDNLDIYLHLQYFTGYGQSLLNYNRREQALRAGFCFYR